jgi:hypothetical protein
VTIIAQSASASSGIRFAGDDAEIWAWCASQGVIEMRRWSGQNAIGRRRPISLANCGVLGCFHELFVRHQSESEIEITVTPVQALAGLAGRERMSVFEVSIGFELSGRRFGLMRRERTATASASPANSTKRFDLSIVANANRKIEAPAHHPVPQSRFSFHVSSFHSLCIGAFLSRKNSPFELDIAHCCLGSSSSPFLVGLLDTQCVSPLNNSDFSTDKVVDFVIVEHAKGLTF